MFVFNSFKCRNPFIRNFVGYILYKCIKMREVVKRVHFSSWSSSIKTHLVSTVQYGQVQLAPLLLSISSELTLEFLQKFLVKTQTPKWLPLLSGFKPVTVLWSGPNHFNTRWPRSCQSEFPNDLHCFPWSPGTDTSANAYGPTLIQNQQPFCE